MVKFFKRFRRKKKKGGRGLQKDKHGYFKVHRGRKFYLFGNGRIFYFSTDKRGASQEKLPKHLKVKVTNGLIHVVKR